MKRAETDQEDIQSLARAHAADAIAVLAEIMNNPDAPAGARLSAAKALLDRGWGKAGAKPPEDGNRATPVSQIRRVIVDPRQGDERRKFGDRSTIPASERTERDCEKHALACFSSSASPRIARRPIGRLTPKFRCRGICRTRVRPPPSGPPIKNPAQGRVFIGGQRGIRTLERLSPLHTFQACAFNHSATLPSSGAYGDVGAVCKPVFAAFSCILRR